jgi:hypothetical protein
MQTRNQIPIVVVVLFTLDLILCGSYVINYLVGEPIAEFTRLLDLDGEMNIPTWYSSAKMLCVAILFGLFAMRNIDRTRKSTWTLALLPLLFLAFSMDEVASIHEHLGAKLDAFFLAGGDRQGTFFRVTGLWFLTLGIPVVLACLLALYAVKRYFLKPPQLVRKLLLGFGIFFGGALGIEMLSNLWDPGTLGFVMENFFEELSEAAGITLLFWAALDLVSAYGFTLHLDPVRLDEPAPDGKLPLSPRSRLTAAEAARRV